MAGALLLPEPSLSCCRPAPSPPSPQQQGEFRPPLHGNPLSPCARAENGDDRRWVDLLALLPNPRQRDAPLAQPALALRRRLSDTLATP
jgi:hypothetical protein